MYTNYGQNDLAKTHRWELECEADRQRLAASVDASPRRNILMLAISKLGVLLAGLVTSMKREEHVKQSPTPITGKL
jgi:hypothetical protein